MTRRAQREAILALGLVGTFLVVLSGVWSLASRVWSTSFTQTLEVMVAAPFLAVWVLAPLFWAVRWLWARCNRQPQKRVWTIKQYPTFFIS